MDHASTVRDEVRAHGRELRRAVPEVYRGYAQLRTAALAPGALDVRIKELIALAIAVTRECDGCIASHAEGAARAGATEAEVAEALGPRPAHDRSATPRRPPQRARGFRRR